MQISNHPIMPLCNAMYLALEFEDTCIKLLIEGHSYKEANMCYLYPNQILCLFFVYHI